MQQNGNVQTQSLPSCKATNIRSKNPNQSTPEHLTRSRGQRGFLSVQQWKLRRQCTDLGTHHEAGGSQLTDSLHLSTDEGHEQTQPFGGSPQMDRESPGTMENTKFWIVRSPSSQERDHTAVLEQLSYVNCCGDTS